MVPVGSSVILELVLAVHSYHVIAYVVFGSLFHDNRADGFVIAPYNSLFRFLLITMYLFGP